MRGSGQMPGDGLDAFGAFVGREDALLRHGGDAHGFEFEY